MEKLRIGIAGFGKIGKIRSEEILKNKNCKLVAVFDIDPPELFSSEFVISNTFEDLLNNNIDAVFICTYNNVLAEYTIKALSRGIHVFCEKPPAKTVIELEKVKEVFEESKNVILKYGFNHRYHYSILKAKETIDSGKLGNLIWMRGVYGKAGSIDFDKNWRNYKKYSGGGILIDQGIHMLDLFRYFSDDNFKSVKSEIITSFWNIESEDNAFAILKSTKNIVALLHSSATQWKHKFLLELCFEKGYINLDGILSKTNSYAPETMTIGFRATEDLEHGMGHPHETISHFNVDDSWKLEVDEFINSILNKKQTSNGSIYDALEVLKLVESIYGIR